jgi:YfiH family protein
MGPLWQEDTSAGSIVMKPASLPEGLVVGFSGRGRAPEGTASPTEYLARRFADALSLAGVPIVRATQVHGNTATVIRTAPPAGTVHVAGECDILVTVLPRVALVIQTADCVPIVLAGRRAVGVVHAGWRGSARSAAAAGVAALVELGEEPSSIGACMGPAIGACCYEVGGEVAARFAGEFARRSCGGRFRLDLAAVNRAQLTEAGVHPEKITAHPACTMCGGERFASYRRDGTAAGRMIALAVRWTATSRA